MPETKADQPIHYTITSTEITVDGGKTKRKTITRPPRMLFDADKIEAVQNDFIRVVRGYRNNPGYQGIIKHTRIDTSLAYFQTPFLREAGTGCPIGEFSVCAIKGIPAGTDIPYPMNRLTNKEDTRGNNCAWTIGKSKSIHAANNISVAPFINHSNEQPNCEAILNTKGHIVYRTLRTINPGEQLLVNYGKDADEVISAHGKQEKRLKPNDPFFIAPNYFELHEGFYEKIKCSDFLTNSRKKNLSTQIAEEIAAAEEIFIPKHVNRFIKKHEKLETKKSLDLFILLKKNGKIRYFCKSTHLFSRVTELFCSPDFQQEYQAHFPVKITLDEPDFQDRTICWYRSANHLISFLSKNHSISPEDIIKLLLRQDYFNKDTIFHYHLKNKNYSEFLNLMSFYIKTLSSMTDIPKEFDLCQYVDSNNNDLMDLLKDETPEIQQLLKEWCRLINQSPKDSVKALFFDPWNAHFEKIKSSTAKRPREKIEEKGLPPSKKQAFFPVFVQEQKSYTPSTETREPSPLLPIIEKKELHLDLEKDLSLMKSLLLDTRYPETQQVYFSIVQKLDLTELTNSLDYKRKANIALFYYFLCHYIQAKIYIPNELVQFHAACKEDEVLYNRLSFASNELIAYHQLLILYDVLENASSSCLTNPSQSGIYYFFYQIFLELFDHFSRCLSNTNNDILNSEQMKKALSTIAEYKSKAHTQMIAMQFFTTASFFNQELSQTFKNLLSTTQNGDTHESTPKL